MTDRLAVAASDEVAEAVNAVEAELGDAGPGAAAPVGHRAAGPRDGRGAHPGAGRRGRRTAWPRSSPPSVRPARTASVLRPSTAAGSRRYPGAMCGIVGYVGPQDARDVVLDGLRRLEYRGYDSAGVAVVADGRAEHGEEGRQAGQPGEGARRAARCPPATIGIGHTRWATHGGPTDRNAHPHLSADGSVAVIHNGIIENFAALRAELRGRRRRVRAPTPTPRSSRTCSAAALRRAAGGPRPARRGDARGLPPARGRVHAGRRRTPTSPDTLVAARRNSPLVVGVGDGRELPRLATSPRSSRTPARRVELGQDQVVEIDRDRGVTVTDFAGSRRRADGFHVDWDAAAAEKGGYDYFMLKEIAEQPQAVADTLLGRLGATRRAGARRGAAVRPGPARRRQGLHRRLRHGLPRRADRQVRHRALDPASRARSSWPASSATATRCSTASTLVVAISQSGETMDTLMALRHAKEQKARVLAICNTNGSTIPRESDAVLYTHAGPEVAVASTKALPDPARRLLPGRRCTSPRCAASSTPTRSRAIVARPAPACPTQVARGARPAWSRCASWPASLADANTVLFLGRHVGYPVALEGALKLKELAYMHAEGFAAGELKHGPIALIEEGTPVVVVVPSPRGRGVAARQDRLQHPGGPGPRRPHHRDRRGGRRGGRPVRRPPDPGAAHADAARAAGHHRAAAGVRLRDRRRPRATTSTSRATWPSPSPSSEQARRSRSTGPARGPEAGRSVSRSARQTEPVIIGVGHRRRAGRAVRRVADPHARAARTGCSPPPSS